MYVPSCCALRKYSIFVGVPLSGIGGVFPPCRCGSLVSFPLVV